MKTRFSRNRCALSLLLFAVTAAEAREDIIPGSPYTSARTAAMGDASLPLGDDVATGLFMNPAVLGRLRHTQFEPLNLSGNINNNLLNMFGTNIINAGNLNAYASTLASNPNQMSNVGGTAVISVGMPYFSAGVLIQSELGGQVNTNGTVSYRSLYQIIPTVGTGFHLLGGVIRFGYSLQFINQAAGSPTVPNSPTMNYNQFLTQGSTVSNTAGLAITLPMLYLPEIDLVVRNAFNSNFGSFSLIQFAASPMGVPGQLPMTLDGSFVVNPKVWQGATLHIVLVDRDITNQSNVAFLGHLALGMELDLKQKFFLRGGWGSGYPSAGFGIKSRHSEFGLSWFSEELGSHYLSQRDIKIMFQYQLRII